MVRYSFRVHFPLPGGRNARPTADRRCIWPAPRSVSCCTLLSSCCGCRDVVTDDISERTHYTYVQMATKTITVTEEAYESLRAHKRADESFTETLLRLTGERRDVWKGHGAYEDVPGFRESVAEVREELDEDLEGRTDELYGQ